MTIKRTYFPPTTAPQRKLLFETWEQTKNVTRACRIAHVGRTTFYNWLPRFKEKGYPGTGRTAEEIRAKVIEMRQAHPDWGKRRLADELAKANNWVPLVSLNTVRSILVEKGMWHPEETRRKKVS
jgi:transposase